MAADPYTHILSLSLYYIYVCVQIGFLYRILCRIIKFSYVQSIFEKLKPYLKKSYLSKCHRVLIRILFSFPNYGLQPFFLSLWLFSMIIPSKLAVSFISCLINIYKVFTEKNIYISLKYTAISVTFFYIMIMQKY